MRKPMLPASLSGSLNDNRMQHLSDHEWDNLVAMSRARRDHDTACVSRVSLSSCIARVMRDDQP